MKPVTSSRGQALLTLGEPCEEEKEEVSMSNLAQKHEAAYTLEQLATDMETLVARECGHARIVAAAEPLLARFLAAGTLPEAYCRPATARMATAQQGFTLYRLHRGPRD